MTPSRIKDDYAYMYEVDSQALTTAWLNLKNAYNNFAKGHNNLPRYKSRHNPIQTYTSHTTNNNIRIEGMYIKMPKLGLVKLKQHRALPNNSKIKAATIKREAGKYYVVLRIEYQEEKKQTSNIQRAIGLDYSLKNLYVDHLGETAEYPMYYKKSLDKLRRAQRVLSRREKGSTRYQKQKLVLGRLNQKIKNQRKDFLHKTSRYLVNNYEVICIEDLDLEEMKKTKHFRKLITDTAFGTFARYLEYKTKDEGKTLVKIPKYYPSTKTCSICGKLNEIELTQRTYKCSCGNIMDRDHNAAINIAVIGLEKYYKNEYGTDSLAWSTCAH
jgi:putative transposase